VLTLAPGVRGLWRGDGSGEGAVAGSAGGNTMAVAIALDALLLFTAVNQREGVNAKEQMRECT